MDGITGDGVVLGVAAVSAAAVAAWTANHRMERQLKEESERLREQLKHDRDMRDREELRRTLDQAAEAFMEASEGAHRLNNAAKSLDDENGDDEYRSTHLSAYEKVYAAFIQSERLAFRFGESDELSAEFTNAYERLFDAVKALWQPSTEGRGEAEKLLTEATNFYIAFSKLCRPYVGVEIRPLSGSPP